MITLEPDVSVAEDTVASSTAHADCFWCGEVLFAADDLLVCPHDGARFERRTYS